MKSFQLRITNSALTFLPPKTRFGANAIRNNIPATLRRKIKFTSIISENYLRGLSRKVTAKFRKEYAKPTPINQSHQIISRSEIKL